ncbi:GerAB/ArcD/ProY family transporter [Paenisporosarcina indica]|uniref:GerAB/ArcD/ProY family transporter n=1 Tax=Paenisporosarcina indica TaxID=650093 RepID=UPI00094FE0ED|nr:endospore germination permease [Paenisporosarcina indica]
MMKDVKINAYQFLVLVIFFTIGTSILVIPSNLAAQVKQDAWISAIIGTAIGLLIVWLFCTIAQWFPNLTYVQIIEKLLGKWIGIAVSILFILMSFLYTADLLYQSGTFLNIHAMPNTPMAALNILMVMIIIMGVRQGLETIARSAEILILVFFILFIFLVIFVAPEVKFENIQPVFEVDTKAIFTSSFFYVAISTINAVVLLMIYPAFIDKSKQAKTSFIIGNLIGGIIIIVLTLLCITVLGPDRTASEIYPGYELAKNINIADFIQRIEGLMAALWIISLYFKATLYFYVSVLGLAQILNLKDYRPLTLPLGMIAVALSLILYPSLVFHREWDTTTGISISLLIGLFVPLMLVVAYHIRKIFNKGRNE